MKIFSAYSTNMIGQLIGYYTTGSFFNNLTLTGDYYTAISGNVDFINYEDCLKSISNAISSTYTSSNISLRYDSEINRIILSSSIGMKFQFEQNLQNILGFNTNYTSSFFNVITGTNAPWYIWESTNAERSNDTEIYEQNVTFYERIADSGRTYSVGNNKTANYRDFSFVNEPRQNLFSDHALSNVPFTYDVFLKELRKGPYPFVMFDSGSVIDYNNRDGTYEMRADSLMFKPKQKFEDFFLYWDIDLKTRLLSRPNQNTANNFTNLYRPTGSLDQIIPNMILWLNANAGGLFNTNITLNKVNDQSTLAGESNSNTNSRIAFSGSNINWGNKAVYHLSSSVSASITTSLTASNTGSVSASGITIVAIGEFIDSYQDTVNYRPIAYIKDTPSADNFFIGTEYNQVRKLCFSVTDASVGSTILTSSQISLGDKFVAIGLCSFSNPKTGSLYINGSTTGTGYTNRDATNPALSASFDWALTSLSGSDVRFPGMNCAEYIVFNRQLTTSEINTILNYASSSYGITSSLL